jgi:hypothetical protein
MNDLFYGRTLPLRSEAFLVTFGALALLPMTVLESQSRLLMTEVVTVTVIRYRRSFRFYVTRLHSTAL